MQETLRALREENIQVIVMAQVPGFLERDYEFALRKKYFLLGLFTSSEKREIHLPLNPKIEQVNSRMKNYFQNFFDVSIFDPISEIQDFRNRLPYRKVGMAYKDGNHLNENGSLELARAYLLNPNRLEQDLPAKFFEATRATGKSKM